jgi:hypothetical protein
LIVNTTIVDTSQEGTMSEYSNRIRVEPDLIPINQGARNGESRWFVAIQDNRARIGDPPAEELTFRRHQLVKACCPSPLFIYSLFPSFFPGKVYGDVEVDENGYFWAEIRGRYGLVPAGKLVEIVNDDMLSEMEDEEEEGQK